MTRRDIGWLLWIGLTVLCGAAAFAANTCIDCHRRSETIASLPAWYQDQFIHWYGSVHGKAAVTCEKCHGGDPTQTDRLMAHRRVLPSGDPKSAIHYKNLPETCGGCHKGVYQQFTQSRHYKNLKTDRLAPTCTTCHGFEMDIQGVTPAQLAGRCRVCHNEAQGVKPEVADLMDRTVGWITAAEQSVQRAQAVLSLAKEQGTAPKEAEALLVSARERFKKTGDLWHGFRPDRFKQELTEIQAAADKAYTRTKQALFEGSGK
jgi:hypothetical protein